MTAANRQSQLDKIKVDLLTGQPVDSVTAFNRHYITRLSAIIKRLRDSGWPISTDQEKGNGIARYSLPDGWKPGEPATNHPAQKSPLNSAKI